MLPPIVLEGVELVFVFVFFFLENARAGELLDELDLAG